VKPDTFAAVMATGIVSIAALDHGFRVVSDVLIVLAAGALPVLIAAAATAWRRESWNLNDLDVAIRLCTYIAACAVVGARLAEHRIVLWMLAGMALQGWLSLAPVVARRMWRDRGVGLRDRAHGGWELASVATSGLAIVTADLKIVFLAVLFWVVAIGVYLAMTGLVVWRAIDDSSAPELLQPDIDRIAKHERTASNDAFHSKTFAFADSLFRDTALSKGTMKPDTGHTALLALANDRG